ncbi:DEKNAAC105419 [Brettanomyces naardenensis]|uniref:DEKNAAC105419 n=1 Tax=Brettanomyces naardenensis TaxID=13370 RepID=A0A448YT77_BRENA|nr:DEKNAAC105419 [Brettanomyces naardenensis]
MGTKESLRSPNRRGVIKRSGPRVRPRKIGRLLSSSSQPTPLSSQLDVELSQEQKQQGFEEDDDGFIFKRGSQDVEIESNKKRRVVVRAGESRGGKVKGGTSRTKTKVVKTTRRKSVESADESGKRRGSTKASAKTSTRAPAKTSTKTSTKTALKTIKTTPGKTISKAKSKAKSKAVTGKVRGPKESDNKRPPAEQDAPVTHSLLDVLEYANSADDEDHDDSWFSEDETNGVFSLDTPKKAETKDEKKVVKKKVKRQSTKTTIAGEVAPKKPTGNHDELIADNNAGYDEPFDYEGPRIDTTVIPVPPILEDPILDSTSKIPLKLSVEEDRSITQNSRYTRRSSLSNRGKRLSSVGNGFIAEPHSEVPIEQFYEHFDYNLSDPQKMRQLLIWCCRRIDFGKSKREQKAVDIASKVKGLLTKDLKDGKLNISWWNNTDQEEEGSSSLMDRVKLPIVVKPNEANIRNLVTLKEYRTKLDGLNREESQWTKATSKKPIDFNELYEEVDEGPKDDKLEKLRGDLANMEEMYKDKKVARLRIVGLLEDLKYNVHKLKQSDAAIKLLVESKMKTISSELKKMTEGERDSMELLKLLAGTNEDK